LMTINALRAARGNRTEAAKRLGLSRRTLHRKILEYHLEDL
jgi:two-component system, NtrC family, response regulator AtoC